MGTKSTLTDKRLKYWHAYINNVKTHMRLTDWDIDLSDEFPEDEDAIASINVSHAYHRATIYLSKEFDEESPSAQRETIAHELVHCHIHPLREFANTLAAQLGSQAQQLAYGQVELFMETATEDLAQIIARRLPMPPLPKMKTVDAGLSSDDTA